MGNFALHFMAGTPFHIALVGNPNSGKSSLFNCLTGLHQKVGNFPGVTVDKHTGITQLATGEQVMVTDLPGTYSLYPKRLDEWVSYRVLLGRDDAVRPDLFVVVIDASNLKRNLLFCSQILDLKKPVVVAMTMTDLAKQKGIQINLAQLERELGVPVVAINPRKGKGIPALKKIIEQSAQQLYKVPARDFIDNAALAPAAIKAVQAIDTEASDYAAVHLLINHEQFSFLPDVQQQIEAAEQAHAFNPTKTQAAEIIQRYGRIKHVMQVSVAEPDPLQQTLFTDKLDHILLHRRWGYLILLGVLFLLFQSVFLLAQYPMDGIERLFSETSGWVGGVLPQRGWADLFVNGILAGLSGIFVFVPQIMILFGLITLLEDTGYMARISFLTDRLMRSVGLNGKSVMPLISGFACAVPAIMSARSIENRKERLLTILVTPLISCAARLPVYTILIALVIPNTYVLGFISVQGLVLMGLYLLGTVMALVVAYIAKWFIKIRERSFFILELPAYRAPRWNNIAQTMLNKARIFVVDAGKVIMIISLLLWALSSFGPSKRMEKVEAHFAQQKAINTIPAHELDAQYAAARLENSYAGVVGKSIEPVIKPLGYDWRMGIAIIASFAAREVFVGTMATLYSVGTTDDDLRLRDKMKAARRPDGQPQYNLASGLSLMVFYVFAMQCMSTLAITRRETKTWKWPVIQFVYMTALAYISAWIVYQVLS